MDWSHWLYQSIQHSYDTLSQGRRTTYSTVQICLTAAEGRLAAIVQDCVVQQSGGAHSIQR